MAMNDINDKEEDRERKALNMNLTQYYEYKFGSSSKEKIQEIRDKFNTSIVEIVEFCARVADREAKQALKFQLLN